MPRALRSSLPASHTQSQHRHHHDDQPYSPPATREGSYENEMNDAAHAHSHTSQEQEQEQDPPNPTTDPPKFQGGYRTQIRKSCQFCRRRKIKCVIEEGNERCNACIKRPMQDCRFAERGAPDDPPPPKPWERNPRLIVQPGGAMTAIRVAPRTGTAHRFLPPGRASTSLPYYPPQATSASAAAAGSSAAAGYGYTTQDMYRRASENTAYGPYSQLTQAQQNSLRASTSRLGSVSYPGTAFPSRSHAYDFMATPMRPSMSQPRMTYPSFPNIDFNTSGGSARLSYGGPYEPTSSASTTYIPAYQHRPSSAHALLGLSTSSSAMSGYEQPPYSGPAGQDTASYEGSEARPAETSGPTAIYRDEAGNEYNLPVVDARPVPSSSLRQTFAEQGSGRFEPAQQQQGQQGLPALPGIHDSRGYAAAPYYWSADRQHQHYMRGQPTAAQAGEHHEHVEQQHQQQYQHASSTAYAQHYHDQQQHQHHQQEQRQHQQEQQQQQQQHSQQSAPSSPERRHGQMDSGFVSEGGYLPPGQPAIWSGAHYPAQQPQQPSGAHHGPPGTPYSSHPPTAQHTPVAEREQDYASQQEYASPQHPAVASSYARQDPRSPGLPNPGGPPQSPYARTTRST